MTIRTLSLCALILTLAGCGEYSLYTEAKTSNTPEAYRAYLDKYPDGVNAEEARGLLDSLDWDIATDADDTAAFELYLEQHPDGVHAEEARSSAESTAMRAAELVCDRAAYEGFLARYPEGALADRARKTLALMDRVPQHLEFGETKLEEGERARFSLDTEIKNIGTVEVIGARVAVGFLDEAGSVVGRKNQWVVADRESGIQAPEESYAPLRPGKSRAVHLELPRSQTPSTWPGDAEHIRLDVIELELAAP
jgi:hypothetical protein